MKTETELKAIKETTLVTGIIFGFSIVTSGTMLITENIIPTTEIQRILMVIFGFILSIISLSIYLKVKLKEYKIVKE